MTAGSTFAWRTARSGRRELLAQVALAAGPAVMEEYARSAAGAREDRTAAR